MALTPRLNPFERLIYRFYEALYLLCLLGNVRGPHVATVFDPSSLIAIRRRFLKNLAFLCDNLKGGDSTASIAVQDLPHCNVFWISSNQGPSDEVLEFLSSVLEDVKLFKSRQDDRAKAEEDLVGKCVQFSFRRMRKQARSLMNNAQKCRNHLLAHATNDRSKNPVPHWIVSSKSLTRMQVNPWSSGCFNSGPPNSRNVIYIASARLRIGSEMTRKCSWSRGSAMDRTMQFMPKISR